MRVVAATNRDLSVEVNKGRFREDLFYRLAVARVHVPPLRERKDDIPLLVEHFLQTMPGGEKMALRKETVDLMLKHDWPGNVRELRNVIERAVLLSEAPGTEASLRRSYLPGVTPGPATVAATGAPSPTHDGKTPSGPTQPGDVKPHAFKVPIDVEVPFKIAKQEIVEEFERRYIRALLERHAGNISAAARAAGIDRMSIHKILNRLGMDRPKGD
jgi:DNA-binding NtrC family response regulator